MKICLSFFLFLCSHSLSAQPPTKASTRTKYYTSGIAASVAHFDSILNALVQQRYEKKITETDFLMTYLIYENQYKAQQDVVAILSEKWASKSIDSFSKNTRNALALVAKGKPALSALLLQQKLRSKKIAQQQTRSDYLFLAELFQFFGDNYKALKIGKSMLDAPDPSVEEYLKCATLASAIAQDSLALIWAKKAEKINSYDTVILVGIKKAIAKFYINAQAPSDAQASLIEAKYLVENFTKKNVGQLLLLGQVLSDLAAVQLSNNDFDNAVRNSKSSVALIENLPNKSALGEAYRTLALVYKKAGANREADTIYQKAIALYSNLAFEYPECYNPILADVLDEYAAVHKWFDRNDYYDKILRQSAALRKQLKATKYPFFEMGYAKNLIELGQKKMNIDVKVYLAEAQWKEAKDVLGVLNAKHPMIAGNELCNALYKVGGVKLALDSAIVAKPAFAQSLAVREYLFRLAPSQNKFALMNVLYQNASLNTISNKNNELAIDQLSRAKMLADELGDTRFAADIQALKLEILKK